jgi:hypothetical protein
MKLIRHLVALSVSMVVIAASAADAPPGAGTQAAPALRPIPGITAEDPFPRGCVDCHVNMPDRKMDARFSTLMKQWESAVDPALLARVQPFAPSGVVLKGKHPKFNVAAADIPTSCISCHAAQRKAAPAFDRMIHGLHLTGGEKNHFLVEFQGQCTYCHKLDAASGAWSLGHGKEAR